MRRWRRSFGRRLLLALVAGLLAAGAGFLVVASNQSGEDAPFRLGSQEQPPAGDLVTGIARSLRHRHLYVSPVLRSRVTPAQQAAIERALTAHADRPPRYLVWLQDTHDGGYRTEGDVAQQLATLMGQHALYTVVDERMDENRASTALGYEYIDPQVLQKRPADGLLDYARVMGSDLQQDHDQGQDRAGPAWGGIILGVFAFVALVTVVALLGVITRFARRRAA